MSPSVLYIVCWESNIKAKDQYVKLRNRKLGPLAITDGGGVKVFFVNQKPKNESSIRLDVGITDTHHEILYMGGCVYEGKEKGGLLLLGDNWKTREARNL
jgi:hypothetical protein